MGGAKRSLAANFSTIATFLSFLRFCRFQHPFRFRSFVHLFPGPALKRALDVPRSVRKWQGGGFSGISRSDAAPSGFSPARSRRMKIRLAQTRNPGADQNCWMKTGVMKIIQFRDIFFRQDLFPLAAICTGWFGSVEWVGRYPGFVANSTSLEIDGPTILHGAQPTIFRANSSFLRTNGTAAAREMVGWASYNLEGHGRKQALKQPQTPGYQPTHAPEPGSMIVFSEQKSEINLQQNREHFQPMRLARGYIFNSLAKAQRRQDARIVKYGTLRLCAFA